MYSCMCTRSGMNMYVRTHVSILPDSLSSTIWAYRSILPSMHRHIDISIEHAEPHAMRYAHALVIIQINPPVDMLDMTWPIPLLGDIAIGIYWNDVILLFLVSQTHTRITLAVNPPHPIFPVIVYLLLCTRVYVRSNYTATHFSKSCNLLCMYDLNISLLITSMSGYANRMQMLVIWLKWWGSHPISPYATHKRPLWW